MAIDEEERRSYEYNARNQITLWGPNGEIRDYANKQWSGVMADYFKPRWELFLNALEKSLIQGTKLNTTEINNRIFQEVERPFTFSTKLYPVESKGIYRFLTIVHKCGINCSYFTSKYLHFFTINFSKRIYIIHLSVVDDNWNQNVTYIKFTLFYININRFILILDINGFVT